MILPKKMASERYESNKAQKKKKNCSYYCSFKHLIYRENKIHWLIQILTKNNLPSKICYGSVMKNIVDVTLFFFLFFSQYLYF